MKEARLLPAAIVLIVLLALSAGLTAANSARVSEPSPSYQGPAPAAALGTAFTYQGQLLKDGSPVDATCTMVFALYDDAVAGNRMGSPITSTVAVAGGLFTTVLNSNAEFGLGTFDGTALWLQVAVQCPGDPAFTTLAPRQALTATPYALSLRPAARVEGDTTATILSTRNRGEGDGLSGRSDSTHGRGVYGWVTATSGETHGVEGTSSSTAGYGVYGRATATTGTTYGVYGRSDSSTWGYGVYGEVTATSGNNYGVLGRSASTGGTGVYGYADATTGTTWGVEGFSGSTDGRGVGGVATAISGYTYGVYGRSDSTNGRGVVGHASVTSGATYGAYASSASTAGTGVSGRATATSGDTCGVEGVATSTAGTGVYGYGGEWAIWAQGDFGASGSKSAVVQTPDYGWRRLYTMESPEVLFEDVGTARLVDGQAIVPIDPVFAQTVNLQRPYQVFLTPQGGYCALYVAEKTSTSFTVRAQEGASCQVAFDYRLIAKRLGYEDVRLAPAHVPARVLNGLEGPTAPQEQP